MKEKLILHLKNLEKKENITILMAAVTGSHSFGLSSAVSDYDVRFVFVHNEVNSYLSINQPVEVIQMNEGILDFVGWDLFKASRLMLKSNPTLFELFRSPILLIVEPNYYQNILDLIEVAFSKKVLGHHYLRIMSANIQQLVEKKDSEIKQLKTLVHVYRSYLTVQYLIQNDSLPPINVWDLIDSIMLDGETKKKISSIFIAKEEGDFSNRNLDKDLLLLKGELPSLKKEMTKLPVGTDMEAELNQILWSILKGR